jgi:hypothetical protein
LKTCYDGAKPDRTVRAYRDPHAAHARLTDLLKQHSWADASARVAAEPAQLGRLRGRDGIFAGRFAQLERANAILAARSVGYSLTRIAEAEQRAERGYRESVAAQSRRDAVGIPKLSAAAMAVLEAVHAVRAERSDEPWRLAPSNGRAAVAQAWETGRRNPAIAAEIDRFEAGPSSGSAQRVSATRSGACATAHHSQCRVPTPGSARRCISLPAVSPQHDGDASIIKRSATSTRSNEAIDICSVCDTGRDRAWDAKV